MRFKIGEASEAVYDMADLDRVSLFDILTLEKETKALGFPVKWADVQRWSTEMDQAKSNKEREEHPAAVWLTAVSIWAARRLSGERIGWQEAIDFPLAQLLFIDEEGDDGAPPAVANPTRPPARKASAPARARAGVGKRKR